MRGKQLNKKHVLFYETFQPLVMIYLKLLFDYRCEKVPKMKENYIVLSNHVSDYDPLFVAASFRKQMYFVASEHIARWGWLFKLIDFFVAPIIRYKGTVAASTALDILKKIKGGSNVCIFAEGTRTWDGVSAIVLPSTAKLIKKAGCGLVTYKIIGGYFASPMWSGASVRKGPVSGGPVNIYTKEQIAEMTNEEIYEIIQRDLYEDAYARQLKDPKKYRGKNLAKNMENLLFICPCCGKKDTFHSYGSTVECKECGLLFTYDEYGMFHGAPFQTVKELSDWQKEQTIFDIQNGVVYTAEEAVLLTIKDHKESFVAKGKLSFSKEGLSCGEFEIAFEDISELAMHGQRAIVFTANKQYYELIPKEGNNAYKFFLYYELSQDIKN